MDIKVNMDGLESKYREKEPIVIRRKKIFSEELKNKIKFFSENTQQYL